MKLFDDNELRKFRTKFGEYDEDGSGTIAENEMRRVCRELGEHVSRERLGEILSKIDVDHSGALDFQEFVAMILMVRSD